MYFIYLPAFERYKSGNEHIDRNFVIQTVKELKIPIIDIHTEVFEFSQDPLSLFPLRTHNHYNAEGYRLIAETISLRLNKDGIFD